MHDSGGAWSAKVGMLMTSAVAMFFSCSNATSLLSGYSRRVVSGPCSVASKTDTRLSFLARLTDHCPLVFDAPHPRRLRRFVFLLGDRIVDLHAAAGAKRSQDFVGSGNDLVPFFDAVEYFDVGDASNSGGDRH